MNFCFQSIHYIAAAIVATSASLSGCSSTSPIQPAASDKSGFEGAVYSGETTVISNNPGIEEFRVFHQGATGFVSVQSVRESAEKRATEFCNRSEKRVKIFRETASKPPHILGNFPRIELFFGCVENGSSGNQVSTDQQKYKKIAELKALLDSGALTKDEFEREKAKVLGQP